MAVRVAYAGVAMHGALGLVVEFYDHPRFQKGLETGGVSGTGPPDWYTVMVDGKFEHFREDFLETI
jgi:hypothetical protein